MAYRHGDYYALCDRCGAKKLRSQMTLDVIHGEASSEARLLVCEDHVDGYHPQTRKRPIMGDPRSVSASLHRPEGTPIYRISVVWGAQTGLLWGSTDQTWGSVGNEKTLSEREAEL